MGEILPDGTMQGYFNYKGKTNIQGNILDVVDKKIVKTYRILNVKKTTKNEIQQKCNTRLPLNWADDLYIRCNAKGIINWDLAPVYQECDLIAIGRGNYKVHCN